MICPKCAARVPDDAEFCGNCGVPVAGAQTPSAQAKKPPRRKAAIACAVVGVVLAAILVAAFAAGAFVPRHAPDRGDGWEIAYDGVAAQEDTGLVYLNGKLANTSAHDSVGFACFMFYDADGRQIAASVAAHSDPIRPGESIDLNAIVLPDADGSGMSDEELLRSIRDWKIAYAELWEP